MRAEIQSVVFPLKLQDLCKEINLPFMEVRAWPRLYAMENFHVPSCGAVQLVIREFNIHSDQTHDCLLG